MQALQLEISKTKMQDASTVRMLESLALLGYTFKQVPNSLKDSNATLPRGSWRDAPGPWAILPYFPSSTGMSMKRAYETDIQTYSTNLIASLKPPRNS